MRFVRHWAMAALWVATAVPATAALADDDTLPAEHQQGDIRWRSGGIGEDEASAMKAARTKYALSLLFASTEGGHVAYESDIHVGILKADGSALLDAVAEGPYMLVDLPNGKYKIVATARGESRSRQVTIAKGKPAQASFEWKFAAPAAVAKQPVASPSPAMATQATAPAAAASAAEPASPAAASSSPADEALPAEQQQGDVRWRSGGIGEDEASAMKKAQVRYPLNLLFASTEGGHAAYESDIHVSIRKPDGSELLEAVATGPYMLIDLPNGKYKIVASARGEARTRDVSVAAGKHAQASFQWTFPAPAQ